MFFHLPSIFLSPVLYSSLILLFSIHRPIIMSTSSNNVLRCNNLKCRSFLSMEGQAVVTTCSRASLYHSYLTDLVRYLLQCVLSQKRHGGILKLSMGSFSLLRDNSLRFISCLSGMQSVSSGAVCILFNCDLPHITADRGPPTRHYSDDIVVRC